MLQEPMDDLRVLAEKVASQCGKTYEALMQDAGEFHASAEHSEWPEHILDNSERYKNVSVADWKTFWQHFARVTGKKANERYDWAPYTCSC